jgi:DNA-binding PadR family transcriptional regulator
MSTTRLLILGLVKRLQPVHGYDLRRALLAGKADIRPGSVYHAGEREFAQLVRAEAAR